MESREGEGYNWEPFIGRALGYLCLHLADMRSKTLLEQADFLMGFGLPRKEAAVVLGTSDESLRVLASQRAKRTSSGSAKPKRVTPGRKRA